jgi:hypothetical protein
MEYGVLEAGSFGMGGEPEGVVGWLQWEGDQIIFGGGELHHTIAGLSGPGVPLASATLDEPVVIDLNPPVGVPQTFTVKGNAFLGGETDPSKAYPLDVEVIYEKVADDVTVETSMGAVSGCRQFRGSTSGYGMSFEGDAWYHPELGMIAGYASYPEPNGTHLDLLGIQDYGEQRPDVGSIQATGLVGPGRDRFSLNTYDVNQEFDADKNRHAKMFLEIRWTDEARAKSDLEPAAIVEFGVPMGYFPHQLVASPVSIFHPEENGKGYTFWVAYVDQAAKNNDGDGIAYHIDVAAADYATSDMRVTARILYRKQSQ